MYNHAALTHAAYIPNVELHKKRVNNKMTNKGIPTAHKIMAGNVRVGKENATLLDDLMTASRVRGKRNAYLIMEQLVTEYGYVIAANKTGLNKGYYIPANQVEFDEMASAYKQTVDSMTHRYECLLSNYKAQQ